MIGIDATIRLGREFGGMNLYLPKMDSAIRPWRDEMIRAEFNGANVTAIARKYHLTSTRVRQILGFVKEK
jgi:Mor family transcriptional regulator